MTRAAVALALALVLAAAPAIAHAPTVWRDGAPYAVEDYAISYALYGEFQRGDERFVADVDFGEDFALPVELFVPHREGLESHRPAWALVGPGLPAPTDAERAALPMPLPDGAGAIVDLNRVSPRQTFYEFFTRRFFWTSGAVAIVVPRGKHQFWVWAPDRTRGKFGLGFGVEEKFDFGKAFDDFGFYAY